ncbi:MAG: DUF4962 domain-containing protein, partial [Candidatus Hydrogenedentes bacterium]|nr:DUF4962 domain-containing protein [Candidatus Hydrogenedentota bacterium]
GDDESALAGGVRPKPASVSDMNPPAFTWAPDGRAAGYAFEIHAGVGYQAPVYVLDKTPWSAHCPNVTLEKGKTYSWRYATLSKDGERGPWQAMGQFRIGEQAVDFPQPPLGDLVRRLSPDHPRLFIRPEQIEGLRGKLEGPLQGPWHKLKAAADKLLERLPDTREPARARQGVKQSSEEAQELFWGNVDQVFTVGEAAATLGFVYMLSGEKPYGLGARHLLLEMCKWDPQGATSLLTNDEAGMPMLYLPARTYTWIYPLLDEHERVQVRNAMQKRGRLAFLRLQQQQHLWKPYRSHYNRLWHFLGECAIAFQGEIPEADQWLDYSMTVFFTCYPVWGGSDGGWHEGAAYWGIYMRRIIPWILVMRSAFDIDAFDKPFFRHTGYYPLYLLPPGTSTGGLGDIATSRSSESMANLMQMFARLGRNPHWQWYAKVQGIGLGQDYVGFLCEALTTPADAKPPTDLPASAVFPGVGLATLNTSLLDAKDNAQIVFKSSPYGRQSHGYNSNNAFLLNLRGKPVFISSGRRDLYGGPHHRDWMWQTKSDNAILINGQGQLPHTWEATGKVTLFETHPAVDIVEGDASGSYAEDIHWIRRILFFKPNVILIQDVLSAPAPSRYQWLLHAPSKFSIEREYVKWTGEAGTVRVYLLKPDRLAITQTDVTEPQPVAWSGVKIQDWHLKAGTILARGTEEFITLMVLDEAPVTARYAQYLKPDRVRLTLPEGKVDVVLERNYFHISGLGMDKEFRRR